MWRSNIRAQSTEVDHQIVLHVISPVTLYRSCIRRLIRIHLMILCSFSWVKNKMNNFFYSFLPFIPKKLYQFCKNELKIEVWKVFLNRKYETYLHVGSDFNRDEYRLKPILWNRASGWLCQNLYASLVATVC